MPSSFSASLRFELQFPGENINLWGNYLDNTLSRVDDAIAGYVTLPIAATGDYTLQSANTNATADEARRAHLKLTGSPAANFQVIIPAVSKNYWIWNATGKTATFTTGSGGTAAVEAGDKIAVWCDGTNVNHGLYFGGYPLKDYIAAQVLASSTALPGQIGNAGKFLKTDGAAASWQQPVAADISDFDSEVRRKTLVYTLIFGGA